MSKKVSEEFYLYIDQLISLHKMYVSHNDESLAANEFREDMADLWYKMSDEERDVTNHVSEQLRKLEPLDIEMSTKEPKD